MKKIIGIFIMMLMIGTVASQVSACTGFTYSDENIVLVGNNEDWSNYNFNIRFIPAEGEKYGCMFIEISHPLEGLDPYWYAPFGGMNDQGLFYDSYATPYLKPVNSSDKPDYWDLSDHYKFSLLGYCLANCATIEEVILVFNQYNLEWMDNEQILWVDRTGTSIIIEGDDIIYKEGNFQVVTNFLQSHPELGEILNAFERYDIVMGMLENITDPSVEYFRDICNATHQFYDRGWTVYSNVCDLTNQIIYLYYSYDYDNLVVIDLNEELEKGEHVIYLGSLFEPEDNQPPDKPDTPKGDELGNVREDIVFNCKKTTDPNDDYISYKFDWDDGTYSNWITSHIGMSIGVSATHSWTKRGTYEVCVKAMDQYGAESEWSDPLIVSMPKNKAINQLTLIIERLIERFPILKLLLD
jgi:penicillin V acylase-like amidase (Ntn superfamily)